MTKNIAVVVQRDVTDQMKLIREMSLTLEAMFEEAQESGNKELLLRARTMAFQLDELSKKAYDIGETVLAA